MSEKMRAWICGNNETIANTLMIGEPCDRDDIAEEWLRAATVEAVRLTVYYDLDQDFRAWNGGRFSGPRGYHHSGNPLLNASGYYVAGLVASNCYGPRARRIINRINAAGDAAANALVAEYAAARAEEN